MTRDSYVAFDQWGGVYHIGRNPPRKWLLEHFCRQHAGKIYIDLTTGKALHVGYVVAGHWCDVFKITPFRDEE